MTLSHAAQTRRAIEKAAREVAAAAGDPAPISDSEAVERIEEHIGWDFDDDERALALAAYRGAP